MTGRFPHQATSGPLPWRGCAAGAVMVAGLVAVPALAQDASGVLLRFGVSQELRHETNPGLNTDDVQSETSLRTNLSADLISETVSDRLVLSASGALEFGDVETRDETVFVDPDLQLSYRREAARSAFDVTATLRERDVDTLDFDFELADDGALLVSSATGLGRQRVTSARIGLDLWRDTPARLRLSYGVTDTRYVDVTDPNLTGSQRHNTRAALTLDFSPVTSLTTTLSHTLLEQEDDDDTQSTALSFNLQNERPDGVFDIAGSLTASDEGNRTNLSVGRSLETPRGVMTGRLGLSQEIAGSIVVVGSLNWQQPLPRGTFSAGISQNVGENERGEETQLSLLNLGLSHEFSPSLSGNFGLGLRSAQVDDVETSSADLSASLRYEVTQDWGLNFSASHRIREEDGASAAESTTFGVSLSRTFEVRP
ncbi:hypothetical protein [Primorskyibacter sp. S187A]|uniref:hypothetical protein n=1 Tax=Primorskyibacter sp. S187A TaxID=3415130 RepID=UPI003C7A25F8